MDGDNNNDAILLPAVSNVFNDYISALLPNFSMLLLMSTNSTAKSKLGFRRLKSIISMVSIFPFDAVWNEKL